MTQSLIQSTVIVVGGPAGTGKTTTATALADHFSSPFIEGDVLHPQVNVDKMSKGIPLTDDDRWDWLKTLSQQTSIASLDKDNKSNIAIVSCSMLKKVYRDYIKLNSTNHNHIRFRFVFLYTTFEELINRVENRKGHFMKSDMVKSQYEIMEIPEGVELVSNGGDSIAIDATGKTPEQINKEVIDSLAL
ncbi:P-loop containing nucleoside triphosphate hydrolase protein [Scheffersomyces coipomensis]|uniref:P-loop containing nucleoside triphosphate hydrolase protein n=1 Tax=Scheffersomyces coipomensis TaxID=1788519 RepID=UPI00315D0B76